MEAFLQFSFLQRQHKQFLQDVSAEIKAAWIGSNFSDSAFSDIVKTNITGLNVVRLNTEKTVLEMPLNFVYVQVKCTNAQKNLSAQNTEVCP